MPLRNSDRQILQQACTSPQSWLAFETLLSHLEEAPLIQFLENLYEQVDQSDFSLTDWIEALLAFDQWLHAQEIFVRPMVDMLGYIHCCTLTLASTLAPPNLAQLTHKMLKQHGFDATSNASPDAAS